MTKKEILEQFNKKFSFILDGDGTQIGEEVSLFISTLLTDYARSVVERAVPEKKKTKAGQRMVPLRAEENRNGFNTCREQTLYKAEEILKEL